MSAPISQERLEAFAREAPWYHTIELAPGLRTKGVYDHEPYLGHYGFPSSLAGLSVLDAGCADGYFAFLCERLGAARVLALDTQTFDGSVAIDPSPRLAEGYEAKYAARADANRQFADVYEALDVPVGHQFLAARAILSSKVEHRTMSVYDLDQLGEQFDVVFCGDLIQHLKHPLSALEALARATRSECIIALSPVVPMRERGVRESVVRAVARALRITLPDAREAVTYVGNVSGGSFFHFAPGTFREALHASGFDSVDLTSEFVLPDSSGHPSLEAIYHCTKPA
jgi:2-polyprenyl-3-methyl-5-hydroxy-6-metoxy-1,4-benzoquinol methylase